MSGEMSDEIPQTCTYAKSNRDVDIDRTHTSTDCDDNPTIFGMMFNPKSQYSTSPQAHPSRALASRGSSLPWVGGGASSSSKSHDGKASHVWLIQSARPNGGIHKVKMGIRKSHFARCDRRPRQAI
jgi:hypothetical protein